MTAPQRTIQIGDKLKISDFEDIHTVVELTPKGMGKTNTKYLAAKDEYRQNGRWRYRIYKEALIFTLIE
jgi:hypothetical protein